MEITPNEAQAIAIATLALGTLANGLRRLYPKIIYQGSREEVRDRRQGRIVNPGDVSGVETFGWYILPYAFTVIASLLKS